MEQQLKEKNKTLQKKLTNAYSFIRTLKSLHKKGEDLGVFLEDHSSEDLQFRYNKYDLIIQEFEHYYLEQEIKKKRTFEMDSDLVNRIEKIIEGNGENTRLKQLQQDYEELIEINLELEEEVEKYKLHVNHSLGIND